MNSPISPVFVLNFALYSIFIVARVKFVTNANGCAADA
jgi:hypothetical protein